MIDIQNMHACIQLVKDKKEKEKTKNMIINMMC